MRFTREAQRDVYDGAVRDINGLKELEEFVSFVRYLRSFAPLRQSGTAAASEFHDDRINTPIRIGKATVMPAATWCWAPAAGALHPSPSGGWEVVQYSEITHLRRPFGHQRLREGKYTAGQIDTG